MQLGVWVCVAQIAERQRQLYGGGMRRENQSVMRADCTTSYTELTVLWQCVKMVFRHESGNPRVTRLLLRLLLHLRINHKLIILRLVHYTCSIITIHLPVTPAPRLPNWIEYLWIATSRQKEVNTEH